MFDGFKNQQTSLLWGAPPPAARKPRTQILPSDHEGQKEKGGTFVYYQAFICVHIMFSMLFPAGTIDYQSFSWKGPKLSWRIDRMEPEIELKAILCTDHSCETLQGSKFDSLETTFWLVTSGCKYVKTILFAVNDQKLAPKLYYVYSLNWVWLIMILLRKVCQKSHNLFWSLRDFNAHVKGISHRQACLIRGGYVQWPKWYVYL